MFLYFVFVMLKCSCDFLFLSTINILVDLVVSFIVAKKVLQVCILWLFPDSLLLYMFVVYFFIDVPPTI